MVTLFLSFTVSDILHIFCPPEPTPYSTLIWGYSRCTRSPILGLMWAGTLTYFAVKLFSKYSDLCDHGTWTLQTDRQTTSNLITVLCIASRGNENTNESDKWTWSGYEKCNTCYSVRMLHIIDSLSLSNNMHSLSLVYLLTYYCYKSPALLLEVTCIVSPSCSIRRLPALVHGAGDGSSRRSRYLQTMNPDLPFSGQYFTTYQYSQPQLVPTLKLQHYTDYTEHGGFRLKHVEWLGCMLTRL